MDTGTIVQAFPWILLIFTWYSLWNLQGKIHCQFRCKNRTVIDKTIRMSDKFVKFDKGWYTVNPRRIDIKWFKLWGIFPYPMPFLEWKWDTDQPLDPTTFKNTWDSPEARAAADSQRDWVGFNQGIDTQLGGRKLGGFEKWLPWIALVAVAGVAFFVYQQNGKFDVMEQQIQNLGSMIKQLGGH